MGKISKSLQKELQQRIAVCPNCIKNVTFKDTSLYDTLFYTESSYQPCRKCHSELQYINLTCLEQTAILEELERLNPHDADTIPKILAYDELKQNNPNEFQEQITPMIEKYYQSCYDSVDAIIEYKTDKNIPKCPTCGSANVKKISGGKRWCGRPSPFLTFYRILSPIVSTLPSCLSTRPLGSLWGRFLITCQICLTNIEF